MVESTDFYLVYTGYPAYRYGFACAILMRNLLVTCYLFHIFIDKSLRDADNQSPICRLIEHRDNRLSGGDGKCAV